MKNNLTVFILIELLLRQNNAEAKLQQDFILESRIEFINETLLSFQKAGSSPTYCSASITMTDNLDIAKLAEEINNGLKEIQAEINSNTYQEPKLKISGLSKSENLDLNLALENAIKYAKKIEKNPNNSYEIPRIKIHGLSKDQEDAFNEKFKGEVINSPPPKGGEMGIIGVTFVIVAGGIIGHSMAGRNTPVIIPPPADPNKKPLGDRDIPPYREGGRPSTPLSFNQTKELLATAGLKKGK